MTLWTLLTETNKTARRKKLIKENMLTRQRILAVAYTWLLNRKKAARSQWTSTSLGATPRVFSVVKTITPTCKYNIFLRWKKRRTCFDSNPMLSSYMMTFRMPDSWLSIKKNVTFKISLKLLTTTRRKKKPNMPRLWTGATPTFLRRTFQKQLTTLPCGSSISATEPWSKTSFGAFKPAIRKKLWIMNFIRNSNKTTLGGIYMLNKGMKQPKYVLTWSSELLD